MPSEPKTRVMVDILEEHLEELAFLWMQRQEAIRSHEYVSREVADLEQRMEAHVQGLLVGGDAPIPLVEETLRGDDPLDAFAAAYTLLRLRSEDANHRVLYAFREAEGEQLDGIRDALCHGANEPVLELIRDSLDSAPPAVAAAAAEILAFHRQLDHQTEQLTEFFHDDDPQVRQAAWRVVALLGR